MGAATHVALETNKPVLFFSLEMGHLELTRRLLAAEAHIDVQGLQTGRLSDHEWTKLNQAVGRLAEAPIYIDDNPHCTVMEMRAKARRIKARYGDIGLIVIDYLQLMTSGKRVESRQVEVSELSRGLEDPRPRARDAGDRAARSSTGSSSTARTSGRCSPTSGRCGSIEQDADVVMFIYRDEYYNPDSEHMGSAEIIIAKHRNGPTGAAHLAFIARSTKFANMAVSLRASRSLRAGTSSDARPRRSPRGVPAKCVDCQATWSSGGVAPRIAWRA